MLIAIVDAVTNLAWGTELLVQIQQFFGSGWRWVFELVSELGDTQGLLILVGLTFWLSGRRLAYSLIGIVLLAMGTDLLIGSLIGLPRPEDPRLTVWKEEFTPSFPSGHTGVATALWGLLAALDWLPKFVAVLIVAGVMLSRLYLGVHYLGDVVGGLFIGVVIVEAYLRLLPSLDRFLSKLSFKIFQFGGGLILAGVLVAVPFAGSSTRVWQILGTVAGVVIGGIVEYRYVCYSPTRSPFHPLKLLIGLGGVVLLFALSHLIDSSQLLVQALLFFLAALWTLLIAPAIFRWMGASETAPISKRFC